MPSGAAQSVTSAPDRARPHLSVCICTYKRPVLLRRLLEELEKQETGRDFDYSVVVADNDAARSAEALVGEFAERRPGRVTYCCEPQQNIALVRNRAIAHAGGDFIVFIDDDEFPVPTWLADLWRVCERFGVAGVLGPVRPHFDASPPGWLIKGRFCERPEFPTGTPLTWSQCRTGNVLFRRAILPAGEPPFREQFGTGGEDVDFFQRMTARGAKFVWCNEAVAYETVPPSRWTRRYALQRALLRGKNSLKIAEGRSLLLAKSILAVPLYGIVLPFSLLAGHHRFMKLSIKCCDHVGRLLAAVGLHPMDTRPM
ncbi:MAG: glycosyltransferase [Opitutaceae bacterium]|nr:glycosyltransferase [Opitutaceae bacterium]